MTACICVSARSRSLMSRVVVVTPMVRPSGPDSGDTSIDTVKTVPSARWRSVRYGSTRPSAATIVRISASSARRDGGMIRSFDRPSISPAV